MPPFNVVQSQRYSDMLQKFLGGELDITSIAPEIMPVYVLDTDLPELDLLKDVRRWSSGHLQVVAAVGNLGRLQIINPANSGLIVVVQGFRIVQKASAGLISITIDAAAAGAPAPCVALDTRIPVGAAAQRNVATQSLIANNTAAVSGYRIDRFQVPIASDGSSQILIASPAILLPGVSNVTAFNEAANETFTGFFWGYERTALPEELQGVS